MSESYTVGQREAFVLGLIALASRLFYALFIDNPQTLNAGWISVLATAVPAILLGLCLCFIAKGQKSAPGSFMGNAFGRIFCAMLCLFSIFDTGTSAHLFAETVQYMALDSVDFWFLVLPLLGAITVACMYGPVAVSSASRIWLNMLPVLFIILLLTQVASYNPRWLAPVLGPGVQTLARSVPSFLGILTGLVPLWIITQPDNKPLKRFSFATLPAVVCVVVAISAVLCAMLLPPMFNVPSMRTFQYDRLMTNGRVPTSLQFILITIWYGSVILQLAFFLLCAACMLCLAFPRLRYRLSVGLCALAALPLAFSTLAARTVLEWGFLIRLVLILLPVLGMTIFAAVRRRKGKCAT